MRLIPSRRPRKRASTPELLSEKSGSSEVLRFVQCFRRNKERGITRQYRAPTRQAPPLSERQLGTPARYNMECIHTRRDQLSDHVPECTNHSRDSTSPNLHTQARTGDISGIVGGLWSPATGCSFQRGRCISSRVQSRVQSHAPHSRLVRCLAENQPRHTNSMGCAGSKAEDPAAPEPATTQPDRTADAMEAAVQPVSRPPGRTKGPGASQLDLR